MKRSLRLVVAMIAFPAMALWLSSCTEEDDHDHSNETPEEHAKHSH